MKLLRTISTVVAVVGIFVWIFTPFVSAVGLRSLDGVPAASLIFYGNSEYAMWHGTAVYWVPLVSVIFLVLCLLCVFLNDFRLVAICSFSAIVTLAGGGRLAQMALNTIESHLSKPGLSVSLPLLLGIFGILLGVSIVALCKAKDVLRAVSIVFLALGGGVFVSAPFLSCDLFRGGDNYTASSLVFAYGLKHFPLADEGWQNTSLYWMPLVCAILLGICLLFALLRDLRWMGVGALAAVFTLVVGGILASLPKMVGMHLGIGFFLLIGLFAALVCFSILDFIRKREDAANRLKQ